MANDTNYSKKYDIFLSYRRDGGETMAILLYDRLVAKGYNVFLDIESLNSGSFNKKLLSVIEGCTDVVVICSENSLDRCANEGDWVRMEIAHAFKNGKNVVPLMLRGFDWPKVLPDDINALSIQNGVRANNIEFFDAAVDRLADKFLQSVPCASTGKKPKAPKQPTVKTPLAKTTKAILSAALLLVVIACLVFGGIAFLGKKGSPASAKAPEPVASTKSPEPADGYITIKGKQYSTSLTSLDLTQMNLQNEDIVPLQYMKNLTELNLFSNHISDLSPLSGLKNLTKLSLSANEISNLAPLSGLANLSTLYLHTNKITDSDLTPLSALANLYELTLSENPINDLRPLSGLTNLSKLSMANDQITDLTPLSALTNLTSLVLDDNKITDLTPLAGLKKLDILFLVRNQITDLTPLANLTNLRLLNLGVNKINDLTPLSHLTKLSWLAFSANSITDIAPLSGLKKLSYVSLLDNQISNLTPLSGIEDSTTLDLRGNPITDWSPVAHVTNVVGRPVPAKAAEPAAPAGVQAPAGGYITIKGKQYSISLTSIDLTKMGLQNEDIVPLQYMKNLTELRLLWNGISDLTPMSHLTTLTKLELDGNSISDLAPLAGLNKLINLSLTYNKITNLAPLSSLANLTVLELAGNRISDLTPLSNLTNLAKLSLDSNAITDLTPLAGLTKLTDLSVTNEYLANDNPCLYNLTPLSRLTTLTKLNVSKNLINDLTPLSGLVKLEWLHLDYNKIADLSPLSSLTKLSELGLEKNQISNVTPLSSLRNLTNLTLDGNPITDWSPVAHIRMVGGMPDLAKAAEPAAQPPASESKQVPPAPSSPASPTKPPQATTPPRPVQNNAPAEPVYSPDKIPADAVRFAPRGTAYITLKDDTRYVVTGNSLMYQSKAGEALGMKNGFIKDEGGVIPFSDIKWYQDGDIWDVDGEKVDIVQDSGQLYFIELEKKKTMTSVPITQVKSIYFDWANTFDSIVYYALIDQVDGPPLVVPAASMFIEIFGIGTYSGPYYTYRIEIPFPNEENVPLARIKRFEITAVTHTPAGYDHTSGVEIVVEKTNREILKDKIHDAISLCSLSKKGITDLGLHKIKNFTILDPTPERLAATTPSVPVFPTASFSSQALPKPEAISKASLQIEPFRSEGTVRIVMKGGAEYVAPANAIAIRTWDNLFSGVRKNYNGNSPATEFSSMKRLRSIIASGNTEDDPKSYKYEIELRNGVVENMETEPGGLNIILPDGDAPRILPLADVESMDFNWDTPCPYKPKMVTVLKKDGYCVSFPKALFFVGHKTRPPENAIGWSSGLAWENGFVAEKQQTIQIDQLTGVQFLVYRISKRNYKGYDKWLKECKVEFEYIDGRKEITGLGMDTVHLFGVNNHGVTEIQGDAIKYIYVGH